MSRSRRSAAVGALAIASALLVSTLAPGAESTASATGTGTLYGTVVAAGLTDWDRLATVSIQRITPTSPYTPIGSPLATIIDPTTGAYSLTAPAGTYRAFVWYTGTLNLLSTGDIDSIPGAFTPFIIEDGGNHARGLALFPGSTISGTLTGAGAPLSTPSIDVWPWGAYILNTPRVVIDQVTGHYVIDRLEARSYEFQFNGGSTFRSYRPWPIPFTFLGPPTTNYDVDLVDLSRRYSVSGTVTLGSPPVAAGAGAVTVTVEKFAYPNWVPTSGSAATNSAGQYEIGALTNGTYRLVLTPQSAAFLPTTTEGFVVADSSVVQNANLPIALSLSGHVAIDGQSASSGQIKVTLERFFYPPLTTLTDANGNYAFGSLAFANYTLTFSSGNTDYYPPWGWSTAGSGQTEPFLLSSNAVGKDVDIPARRWVSGTVTDSSGNPAGGVEVPVSAYVETGPSAVSYLGTYTATTAPDGTYDVYLGGDLYNYYDLFYVVDFHDPQQRFSDQTWGGLSMYYFPYLFPEPAVGVDAIMYSRSSISTEVSSEHPEELNLGSNDVMISVQVYDVTTQDFVTVLGPKPVGDWELTTALGNLFPDNYRLYLDYTGPNGFQDVLTPPIILDEGIQYKQPFWLGRGASQYTTFSDVLANHPFTGEIQWMFDQGISTGYIEPTGQRSFRPTTAVTRQAMAAFLYRSAGSPAFVPPTSPSFTDVPLDHPFFKEIEWMKGQNISTGYTTDAGVEFRPNISVSRQAMAAFLYRSAGSPNFVPPAAQTFDDVPTDHSFYKEIEWMANAGISVGYTTPTGKIFKLNVPVSRQAMSAFLFRSSSDQAAAGRMAQLPALKVLARSDPQEPRAPVIGSVDREDLVLTLP